MLLGQTLLLLIGKISGHSVGQLDF